MVLKGLVAICVYQNIVTGGGIDKIMGSIKFNIIYISKIYFCTCGIPGAL
jgi:hypothetical protein